VCLQFDFPVGDFYFNAHTRLLVQQSRSSTFHYHFTEEHAFKDLGAAGIPTVAPIEAFGSACDSYVRFMSDHIYVYPATHLTELFHLGWFGTLEGLNVTDAGSLKLANQMKDYWISFVTSLDPNDGKGVGRPDWPDFSEKQLVRLPFS
jgi:carboxylesterase type B